MENLIEFYDTDWISYPIGHYEFRYLNFEQTIWNRLQEHHN